MEEVKKIIETIEESEDQANNAAESRRWVSCKGWDFYLVACNLLLWMNILNSWFWHLDMDYTPRGFCVIVPLSILLIIGLTEKILNTKLPEELKPSPIFFYSFGCLAMMLFLIDVVTLIQHINITA